MMPPDSETKIHPSALVDPKAELGEGVEVGPNAIIEAGVRVGDRTKIGPMAHIQGATEIGPDNVIYTAAMIGFPPQFLGFDGSPTRLVIGARNTIRELVTIHRGLKMEEGATRVGDDNFLMTGSHVAHDCQIGNHVVMVNGALLAGHVEVGDRAFLSGNTAFHQFVRVGKLAMVSGLARVNKDVPPYAIAEGHPAHIRGVNSVGMRRAGLGPAVRMEIKRVLQRINQPGRNPSEMLDELNPEDYGVEVQGLIEFYRTSKRGVLPFTAQESTPGTRVNPEEDEE